ncbi:MAG TPA: hypothetical protein VHW01_14190, partial [Polyangiaceae bacterium]|nr:hypothetical protein [Polyangiaceae bacterium]
MRLALVVLVAAVGCAKNPCPDGARQQGKAGKLQWCARPDGRKHGPWTEWHPSGKLKSQGQYRDGKMEGRWVTYFEDGARNVEGDYKGGLKDGIWTTYYEDGKTKNRVEEHHLGSWEIKWTAWHSDGTKWAEGIILGSQEN